MEMNKDKALIIWESRYGDNEIVEDFAGAWIYKEDYLDGDKLRQFEGDEESFNFGWGLLYKKPLKFGGSETDENLEIVHLENIETIGELKVFTINEVTYEVKEIGHDTHGIFDEFDNRFDYNEASFMVGFDQFGEAESDEEGCGCGKNHNHEHSHEHNHEHGTNHECGCGKHKHDEDDSKECGNHKQKDHECGCGKH